MRFPAIGIYAPEVSRRSEPGANQNSQRPTQTHMDTNYIKGFTVCVCLCVSVANHINEWGMFRLGSWDFGLRPAGGIGAYAPEGLRI